MRLYFSVLLLTGSHLATAQSARYDSLWADAAVEKRIVDGIERHRKGDFTLTITAKTGKQLNAARPTAARPNATVDIRQVRHDFQFGANLFMLNGFPTDGENRQYKTVFQSLFNTACLPFYWKTLEPERGKLRFAASSAPIYRRPPADPLVEFCEANGLTPKGHTLVWVHPRHSIPDWLPTDSTLVKTLITKRIREIADRYGTRIKTWDVVNEVLHDFPGLPMPHDYALFAFREAQTYFPAATRLFINEVTPESWQNYHKEYSPYYLLIENLKAKGARIGGIGLQFHFFSEQLHDDVANGKAMTPHDLYRAMDLYGQFGVPLHVSEITIPTLPNNQSGLQRQATMARNFYRLWFSHPAVDAIIWWNTVDGTAVAGEDKWNGGLVNRDFSPKPACTALDALINREWKTNLTKTLTGTDALNFRGFYGDYKITIRVGKIVTERTVRLTKSGPKTIAIDLN